jgi:GTP-binding protein HflX
LAKKTLALSRLTGGIGGRGPGETKLEIDRRRVRDRIHLLEKELKKLAKRREQQRGRRRRTRVPVLSVIGYTNAGKTTLFNLLTKSQFHVEEKLFATLDTATRRLRFTTYLTPESNIREVVITDTVGFIKNLPKELMVAFRPTFDELQESDLLIHLVDISNPCFQEHIEAVHQILFELELNHIPRLLVFNKEDRLGREEVEAICEKYEGVSISALRPESLVKFFLALEKKVWEESDSTDDAYREISGKVWNSHRVRLTNVDSFDI